MISRPILKYISLAMVVLAVAAARAVAGSPLSQSVITTIDRHVDESVGRWIEFYKTCHSHPELSLHEEQSAARLAKVFDDVGMVVTRGVGDIGYDLELCPNPSTLIYVRELPSIRDPRRRQGIRAVFVDVRRNDRSEPELCPETEQSSSFRSR